MTTPAVMVGLGAGDALGLAFETRDEIHPDLVNWDGGFIRSERVKLPAGHGSDDTDMAICLAESLIDLRGFDPADVARRYLAWSQGEPHGMGSTTRKAMAALAAGKQWHESGVVFADADGAKVGNGTAMRCAPLGVLFVDRYQRESLLHCAKIDAHITHVHPEAVAASYAVAFTVERCLHTRMSGLALLRTAREFAQFAPATKVVTNLDAAVTMMVAHSKPAEVIDYIGRRGNAAQTVATAVYCAAYYADDFEAGVRAAVRGGGDTDTRAAITGAILGARLGLEEIPDKYLRGLHRVDYLRELDAKLFAQRGRL